MYDKMCGQSGRIYSEYRVPAADRNAESECRGIHLCGEKVWKGSKTGADTEGIAGLYVIIVNIITNRKSEAETESWFLPLVVLYINDFLLNGYGNSMIEARKIRR